MDLLKESLINEGAITDAIKKYIQTSKYDILHSWGNCAFYTQDFLDTGIATGVIYMPLANPKGEDPEDHIVPVVNNVIIDFAKVPGKGVSKHYRTGTPPEFNPGGGEDSWPYVTNIDPKLFTKNGAYGKAGYLSNSKYADWEYTEFPSLKKNIYPISLSALPNFATIETPSLKK